MNLKKLFPDYSVGSGIVFKGDIGTLQVYLRIQLNWYIECDSVFYVRGNKLVQSLLSSTAYIKPIQPSKKITDTIEFNSIENLVKNKDFVQLVLDTIEESYNTRRYDRDLIRTVFHVVGNKK